MQNFSFTEDVLVSNPLIWASNTLSNNLCKAKSSWMLTKTYNQQCFFPSEPLNLSTDSPQHNVILMRSERTVKNYFLITTCYYETEKIGNTTIYIWLENLHLLYAYKSPQIWKMFFSSFNIYVCIFSLCMILSWIYWKINFYLSYYNKAL